MELLDFVDQNYTLNPETDVLIESGRTLCEGMRVLVGDPTYRIDLSTLRGTRKWIPLLTQWYSSGTRDIVLRMKPAKRIAWRKDFLSRNPDRDLVQEALRYNRWCTIKNLHLDLSGEMWDSVDFFGQYDDGTQMLFALSADVPWIARKLDN